jgi:hypothetical protein
MKGRLLESELRDISDRYNIAVVSRLDVPDVEGERHLVTITHTRLSLE